MVMRSKDDITLKLYQVIVKSLDTLQIQMVRRRIENQTVGILQLHPGNHTTHLLTAGQHTHLLLDILILEEHTS